jgi:peptide/nickel transport system substrate-binding protein
MNSRVNGRHALVVVVMVLSLVAVACGSKKSDQGGSASTSKESTDVTVAASGPPKVGGTLRYAVDAESDGWDPTKNRWATAGTEIGMAVFDPLAAYDADVKAQPYLAESFTPNADYTQWTIALRPNVTFQDGTPLTADVLKTIFAAHQASALTSPAVAALDHVEVTGPLTAVFFMKQAWAAFPSSLTGQLGMVPSPGMLASPDGSRNPVGTGPFKMVSWTPDSTFVATKNTSYWRKDDSGTQLPYLAGVTFSVVTEAMSKVNGVLSGDIDMAYTSIPDAILKAQASAKSGQIQLVENKGETEEGFVMLNTSVPPFDNATARQAIAYATDASAYIAAVDQGATEKATAVFREGTPYYTDAPFPGFDLDKAKALVAQYQTETGKPLEFPLLTASTDAGAKAAAFLQAQWEAAGIKVSVQQLEQSSIIINAVTGKYQATVWAQFGSPDPDYDYVWWTSANAAPTGSLGLNIARNKDPEIDAALNTARGSADEAVRKQAYATVATRLNVDLPYIWLDRGPELVIAANSVRGLTQGPLPGGQTSYPMGGPGGFGMVTRLTQTWIDK